MSLGTRIAAVNRTMYVLCSITMYVQSCSITFSNRRFTSDRLVGPRSCVEPNQSWMRQDDLRLKQVKVKKLG